MTIILDIYLDPFSSLIFEQFGCFVIMECIIEVSQQR